QLRQPVQLAGAVWGRSLAYGAGVRWDRQRWRVAAEALGSVGLESASASTFPLELIGSGRFALSDALGVRAGAGTGIGRGLGNPAWRLVAGVDLAAALDSDRDLDRRPDVRDLCPRRAEDLDQFRDLEGCPDPDNDHDGIVDPDDRCPFDPEVVNGWIDADGCPDARATLQLVVSGPESAEVAVADQQLQLIAGEVFELEVDPGVWAVSASADGFEPTSFTVTAHEGPVQIPVRLARSPTGGVVVTVVDPEGAPVDAVLHPYGAPACPAPGGRARIGGGPGPVTIGVEAPWFVSETVTVDVPRDVDVEVTVALRRAAVVMVDRQLIVGDKIRFAVDEADPRASGPALDALARWLEDHPEVLLLRIDGHADEVGSSAYNLELSTRRARSVFDALVARGVAPERLAPIGSGESRPWDWAAERWVEFLVLVWDDEVSAEPPR
ncbi:MAG: OmpA family protein, partial [Myxococcota bacterium]